MDGDAVSNMARSPGTHNALQQALRQAEADEWPSQPFSSVQHKGDHSPKLRADSPNAYVVARVRDSQSPKAAEEPSRDASIKLPLFIRPTSSGSDPAAGFSFGRAPPMQQLDFSRKKTMNVTQSLSTKAQQQGRYIISRPCRQGSPPSGQDQASDTSALAPSNTSNSAAQKTATLKLPGPPFPTAGTHTPPETAGLESNTPINPHSLQALMIVPAQGVTPTSADETLVGSDAQAMNDTRAQDDSFHEINKSPDEVSILGDAPDKSAKHATHHQNSKAGVPDKASRQATNTHPRRKVTRMRKKTRTSVPNKGPHPPFNGNGLPDDEILLQMLAYKQQLAAEERQTIQEAQQARKAEIDQLIEVNSELYAQFQDMSQRYSETEAQLSKIKASKSGWESKLKKLNDYVSGLTNDHNRLRDDASHIRERQASVLEDRNELVHSLREIYQVTEKGNAKSSRLVTEARHDMRMLGQTIQHQQLELREGEALLVSERERNKHLEGQIAGFMKSHAELKELFSDHREAITMRIDELLTKASEHIQVIAPTASQDKLTPLLEQCVTLLKELPKVGGGVEPADLQKLEDSMRRCFDGITRSVESCNHNTSVVEAGHQQLALSMHNGFKDLSSNIVSEHTLSEQIMDLREMRATIREQLNSTETNLRDSRLQVAVLQSRESENLRRIAVLESDSNNRPPTQDSQTLLRLQEIDSLNKDLRRDLADQNADVNSLGEQLRQKELELHELRTKSKEEQLLLEEANQLTALVQDEKVQTEKQAIVDREEIRRQLLRTAKSELAQVKSEHLNVIQGLKIEHSRIEEKYQEAASILTVMRKEKDQIQNETTTTKNALAAETAPLRHRIAELEKQVLGKDALYEDLYQELQGMFADNEAKDIYLKAARAMGTKKKTEQSAAVRGADLSMTLLPHSPVIVEDSQPPEHPPFASQLDIMGDDAFGLGGTSNENLSGTPQILDDLGGLNGLFPNTPNQSRTVEITNVSYSRSRLSSREGAEALGNQRALSGTPREASQQVVTRPQDPANAGRNSAKSSQKPHTNPSASRMSSTMSPQKSSESQRQTQESSNVPRGILKQAAQESRGRKRHAANTEVASVAGFTATKRRKSSAPTKGLGPIIADSQSPISGISGRGKKQATRNGTASKKDDRFLQTFKGYTTKEHSSRPESMLA